MVNKHQLGKSQRGNNNLNNNNYNNADSDKWTKNSDGLQDDSNSSSSNNSNNNNNTNNSNNNTNSNYGQRQNQNRKTNNYNNYHNNMNNGPSNSSNSSSSNNNNTMQHKNNTRYHNQSNYSAQSENSPLNSSTSSQQSTNASRANYPTGQKGNMLHSSNSSTRNVSPKQKLQQHHQHEGTGNHHSHQSSQQSSFQYRRPFFVQKMPEKDIEQPSLNQQDSDTFPSLGSATALQTSNKPQNNTQNNTTGQQKKNYFEYEEKVEVVEPNTKQQTPPAPAPAPLTSATAGTPTIQEELKVASKQVSLKPIIDQIQHLQFNSVPSHVSSSTISNTTFVEQAEQQQSKAPQAQIKQQHQQQQIVQMQRQSFLHFEIVTNSKPVQIQLEEIDFKLDRVDESIQQQIVNANLDSVTFTALRVSILMEVLANLFANTLKFTDPSIEPSSVTMKLISLLADQSESRPSSVSQLPMSNASSNPTSNLQSPNHRNQNVFNQPFTQPYITNGVGQQQQFLPQQQQIVFKQQQQYQYPAPQLVGQQIQAAPQFLQNSVETIYYVQPAQQQFVQPNGNVGYINQQHQKAYFHPSSQNPQFRPNKPNWTNSTNYPMSNSMYQSSTQQNVNRRSSQQLQQTNQAYNQYNQSNYPNKKNTQKQMQANYGQQQQHPNDDANNY